MFVLRLLPKEIANVGYDVSVRYVITYWLQEAKIRCSKYKVKFDKRPSRCNQKNNLHFYLYIKQTRKSLC
jgi:hypothetical protein